MVKEKQFYLDCLKNGKKQHSAIYGQMKNRFSESATVVRDVLLAEGYIREAGFRVRNDGKKNYFYELTGKKFQSKQEKATSDQYQWDDGSMKSQGNAFNWKAYAKGLYKPGEIAAQEAGRKFGMSTASRQILPRVAI